MRPISPENACHPGSDTLPSSICVLGIGNLLWADEGFGVRCVEALQQRHEFAPHVSLVDGGTQGLYLIQHVQAADALLIFDAIDYGLEPGTLKLVRDDEVPRFLGAKKMSLHQTGFQEVLAAAALTDKLPAELVLIGVQPEELEDYGGSLRAVVKAQMPPALNLALDWLERWGVVGSIREDGAEAITDRALAMDVYEAGRPSAEQAYRLGDARFLNTEAA